MKLAWRPAIQEELGGNNDGGDGGDNVVVDDGFNDGFLPCYFRPLFTKTVQAHLLWSEIWPWQNMAKMTQGEHKIETLG